MARWMRAGVLFAIVGSVAAAACSGGGGGGGAAGDALSSGEYTFSNYQLQKDTCAALPPDGSGVDGYTSTVTVAGSAIQVLGSDGTYLGKKIAIHDLAPFDWATSSGFDCQQTIATVITGVVTTTNAFDATLTYRWEEASGAECAQALSDYSAYVGQTVNLPCDASATLHLELLPPPVVTPTPTPAFNRCQVYWISTNATITSDWDAFVVDAPITDFTTGTHPFDSVDRVGEFLSQYDPNTGSYAALAIVSSGTYSLTVPGGTAVGDTLGFSDLSAEILFDPGLTAVLATGGDGTFNGTFSDFYSGAALVSGTGTVHMQFGGVTRDLGTLGSYAGCYAF